MKYIVSTSLHTHRGVPILQAGEQPGGKTATIGEVIEQVLINAAPERATGEAKYQQYKLAQRVAKAFESKTHELELNAEEVAVIKQLAAPLLHAIVYGALCDQLEK